MIKNYAWISPNNTHLNMQIQTHVNTILNEKYEFFQFDCKETHFSDIYEAMITPSLFFEGKILVLYHLDSIVDEETYVNQFIQILKRSSDDIILCLQLDRTPDHVEMKKAFDLHVDVQKTNAINSQDLAAWIQSDLLKHGYEMDFSTQQLFLDRLKNQEETMYSYLDILKTYKLQDKHITKEDIIQMVPTPIEDNIFEIVTSYLQRNVKKSLLLYEDLLIKQEDPISILSMISRKLLEIEDVKRCLKVGLDQRQIAEKLNISNGKTYYLMKEAKMFQSKEIEKTIQDLNQLDYKIKSGQIDKTLGVYLFLIGEQDDRSYYRHH